MQIEITFRERPIYHAPLAVLGNLYYYTSQYGLSVRQFTGQHWKDWEKLPKRLRKAQNDPAVLDAVIAELEELAAGSKERSRKRQAQIEGKWAKKENILRIQLQSVLAAMPGELLALGFQNLTGDPNLAGRYRIVDLETQGPEGRHVDFVEPDLLLLGGRHLLMVEVKTAGSSSSHKYPPYQLLNYLRLAHECREGDQSDLPDQFAHLILVASTEPKWLISHAKWVLQTCDEHGRMRVDPEACIRLSKRKEDYDYTSLARLAQEIPIYYRSWQQLYEAFDVAIAQFGDLRNLPHWERIGNEVRELARRAGRYK
jgi:hypothetical protein